MTFLDLLILRKPGPKVAQFAARAEGELQAVARALPELERAGKSLPFTTAPFGGHREREYARWLFPHSSRTLDAAARDARSFATGSGYQSFETLITDAQAGRSRVSEAIRHYGSDVPSNIRNMMDDARGRAEIGVSQLESGRLVNDIDYRRTIAGNASLPLYDAGREMGVVSDDVQRMIAPWRKYDEVRVAVEDGAESAVGRASTSANVKGVGPVTHARAEAALKSARDAETAILALEPRDEVAGVQKAVNTALADLSSAKASAKTEPTPRLFYAKAAGAWATTLGVGAGAGYGIYKLATSGDDN